MINLLDLEAVVIGGGLGTRLGAAVRRRESRKRWRPHLFVPEQPPAVHAAALGDLGGALGAGLLAGHASDKPDRHQPATSALPLCVS